MLFQYFIGEFSGSKLPMDPTASWDNPRMLDRSEKTRDYHWKVFISHRIHGAAIYGNMDTINIPPLC